MPVRKMNLKDSPHRVHYPQDEAAHSWLPALLDFHAIIDAGVRLAIDEMSAKGRKLACRSGCGSCCRTHLDIPVYPHELVGLYWYLAEKLEGPARSTVRRALVAHVSGQACPFLVENKCAVHAMRPAACRQFNVFGSPCAEGEDAYHTRREEVLTPLRDYVDSAFYVAAPFYGLNSDAERRDAVDKGLFHGQVRVLQNCNWKDIARKMELIDAKRRVI